MCHKKGRNAHSFSAEAQNRLFLLVGIWYHGLAGRLMDRIGTRLGYAAAIRESREKQVALVLRLVFTTLEMLF